MPLPGCWPECHLTRGGALLRCISRCWLRVLGRWVGFEKPGFSGECYVLEKGLYAEPDDWGALSFRMASIQPVFYVSENCSKTERLDFVFILLTLSVLCSAGLDGGTNQEQGTRCDFTVDCVI